MSKFFKALEQAERDRALEEGGEPSSSKAAAPPEAQVDTRPMASSSGASSAAPAPEAPAVTTPALPSQKPARRRPAAVPTRTVDGEGTLDRVEEHLVSLLDPTGFEAEQYWALRHWMEQFHKSPGLSVVAVTSPDVEGGKTTTAINLAGALAQAPAARVLLVEVDFRCPSAVRYLGLDGAGSRGLVDAIMNPAVSLADITLRRPPFNLSLVPVGSSAATPYEILGSPRLGELLEEARGRYDYVIVDTPPLVPVPDCRLIGKWVDGFLVVVAAEKTPRKILEEALNLLDPAKILGLVFNEDNRAMAGYHYRSHPDLTALRRLRQLMFSWRGRSERPTTGKVQR